MLARTLVIPIRLSFCLTIRPRCLADVLIWCD